jgi:gluconate 2-dehydrogenase gamma chain
MSSHDITGTARDTSAEKRDSKRRGFLKQIGAVAGSIPLAPALIVGLEGGTTTGANAQTVGAGPAADPTVGYVCFSQDEAAFVETMVNIMCPADSLTPNGIDCGLAIYIDRQLAGDFGRGLKRYAQGPWMPGRPQQGYQLPLTPLAWFKAGVEAANAASVSRFGKPFDQLPPTDANAFLTDLGNSKVLTPRLALDAWFNDLLYPLFAQACFADPIYGGNYNKVFWRLIGYPGLPATHTIDMVQYRGRPFPGAKDPKSIQDFS